MWSSMHRTMLQVGTSSGACPFLCERDRHVPSEVMCVFCWGSHWCRGQRLEQMVNLLSTTMEQTVRPFSILPRKICTRTGPCYRCLFPNAPSTGACSRCSEAGVLGPVPGIIGVLQAMEAIKILTKVCHLLVDGRCLDDTAGRNSVESEDAHRRLP